MFKEAPSKRSKHVSSGGPFKYNHDAENHSPLHIHRFFGGKTGKTIVKLQFLILRPGCFPFSCLFLRAFSPSHMVPERPPPRLKEKKQYPARNHIFYHIVVDIQTFTPPQKNAAFHVDSFYGFLIGSKLHLGEFCNVFSHLRPEFHDASSLNSFGAQSQRGREINGGGGHPISCKMKANKGVLLTNTQWFLHILLIKEQINTQSYCILCVYHHHIYSPRIRRLDFAVLDRTASHAHHNSLGKK